MQLVLEIKRIRYTSVIKIVGSAITSFLSTTPPAIFWFHMVSHVPHTYTKLKFKSPIQGFYVFLHLHRCKLVIKLDLR